MGFTDVITVVAASSAAGKKIFLPGFLFSLLVRLGLVRLPGEIAFLDSLWVMIPLGVLAAAEILMEFYPGVGSAMQSVKLFLAPVMSALLAFCMLGDASTELRVALMLLCAVCGEAVQLSSAGVSMASVQASGGGADPLVNVEEVLSSSAMVLLAVFLPVLAAALGALLVIAGVVGFFLYRRWKRRKAEKRRAHGEALLQERQDLRAAIHSLACGAQSDPPMGPAEAEEELGRLNARLEINRQALWDFEAQSRFPVPEPFRKKGYLYAKSKRRQFVTLLLSILPGLGHVYVGQWQKGLILLAASLCIDLLLTPFLAVTFLPAAPVAPIAFRCIVFTDLEMIRRKLNGSVPVRPFEFF